MPSGRRRTQRRRGCCVAHGAPGGSERAAGCRHVSYSGRTVRARPRRGGELAWTACVAGLEARRTPDLAALPAPRRVAMRLRVRLAGAAGGETHRVVTPEVCDLAALRTLVASRLGMPPASVRLSLNGTDELAPGAAGGATLQVAGIAPGDLLYVLPPAAQGAAAAAAVQATAADAAAAPALAPLTWQQPACGAAVAAHATQPARPAQPAQPSAEARRAACLRALESRGAAGGAAPAADSAAVSSSNAASTAPPATDDDAMDTALTASDALTPSASVPGAFVAAL